VDSYFVKRLGKVQGTNLIVFTLFKSELVVVNEFVCGNKQILLGIILSMTLARHGVREIGLYDLGSIWGF